jgi:hypothetical protein
VIEGDRDRGSGENEMSQVRASRRKDLRKLVILLLSTVVLVSCRPYRSNIEVELDSGTQAMIIIVRNASGDTLSVDNRLLAQGIGGPIKIEVADKNNIIVPPCTYLDYVATGEIALVPPEGKALVSIPVSAVSLTRCLHADELYKFRALLISEGEIVSSAEWVQFQAEIPGIEANR